MAATSRAGDGGRGSRSSSRGPSSVDPEGGGGDKRRKSKKKVMSTATWRKLSPHEREDFFGGVRPGSTKKKVLTKSQKAQRESEGR
jgi:hypothetical protein